MPCLRRFFGEFLQRVAMEGRGGDDVERVRLGIEHGEAVVVLGGDDDVLHAGGLGQRDDVVRGEAGGVELRCERLVIRDGDGAVVHDPLADAGDLLAVPRAGGHGVESPVDEHAETRVAPPRHAGVFLRGRLGVLDGGDGMRNGRGRRGVLRVDERSGEKNGGGEQTGQFHGNSSGCRCGMEIV